MEREGRSHQDLRSCSDVPSAQLPMRRKRKAQQAVKQMIKKQRRRMRMRRPQIKVKMKRNSIARKKKRRKRSLVGLGPMRE